MSFLAGLGSFAGGVSKGLEEGEDIQSKRLQRQQQALTQQGQEALGRYFSQPDQPAPASPLGSGVSGLGAMQGQAPSPSPGQSSQPPSNFGPPSMGAPQMPPGQGQNAPQMPPGQGQNAPARAIAGIETGGGGNPYTKLGNPTASGDRAFGKYQVMGANIAPWTKEVLGRPMSSQEFLANPQAQEAVFKAKFGQLQQKYGPEGAAKAWFAGEGGMNHPDRTDVNGTSVAGYGQKFVQAGGAGPQGASQPSPQGGGQGQQTQGQSQVMQLAQRIKQANPDIKPGVLWQALVQAAPMLNRDAQNALKEQTLQLREQLQQQREQSQVILHQMDNFVKERGQDIGAGNAAARVGATERGQDIGAANADKRAAVGGARLDFDKQKFAEQQKTSLARVELEKQRLSDARTRGDMAAAARAQTALNGAYDAYAKVMEAGARADKPDAAMEAGAKANVKGATEKAAASPPPGPRGEDAPPVEKPPVEGAIKGKDGRWYFKQADGWHRHEGP